MATARTIQARENSLERILDLNDTIRSLNAYKQSPPTIPRLERYLNVALRYYGDDKERKYGQCASKLDAAERYIAEYAKYTPKEIKVKEVVIPKIFLSIKSTALNLRKEMLQEAMEIGTSQFGGVFLRK